MSNTCFTCHGPDEESNPSELRLDSPEAAYSAIPSDDAILAIKPGAPDESEVYARIAAEDPDLRMPPADFRHQLTEREQALFQRWIEQGAKYEDHWSYAPLVRPEVPKLAQHQALPVNDIDRFILARLEAEGIEPTPLADKSDLLRRLSLDLVGLPPTPAEVAAFVADDSDDAYQKQVERLLASPHFGERMASNWLDIVRLADTVGFHGDQNQRIFPYRDYVIDAFNKNKPFDVFTREQLAGDLLENPTQEQLTATGVIRLNMMTREGGAQPKEYLAKYAAERVRMIGTAWMGATLACCECHNHKYDPYTAKDFYSMAAFFDDILQWGVYTTYGYTPNPDLAGFNNDSPFPPEMRVASESQRQRILRIENQSDAVVAGQLPPETLDSEPFQTWANQLADLLEEHNDGWLPTEVEEVGTTQSTPHETLDDGSVLLTGKPVKDESVTLETSYASPLLMNAIRLEVLPDEANNGYVGRSSDGRFELELSAEVKPAEGQARPLQVDFAQADRWTPPRYSGGHSSPTLQGAWKSGPAAWQLPTDEAKLKHTAVYHLAQPLRLEAGERLVVHLKSSDVGRVRLSVSPLSRAVAGWPAANKRLLAALDARVVKQDFSAEQRTALLAAYRRSTAGTAELGDEEAALREKIVDCRSGWAMTLVTQQAAPEKRRVGRVLPRGNWQDESGELVTAAPPGFLPKPESMQDRPLNRLDLANWLTSNENPMPARHFVNRTWQRFFGTGLSGKLDDLGNQGEWPSHPLLLDWLASEFRESGWDVKHMVRLMVNSRTYRQAAAVRSDLADIDPYNRLLAQQSPRRLEAEIVRDNALAISGLISKDLIGGPSVFPYQPAGHYSNLQFPDRRYQESRASDQYRRGVYMHWQRTFLHPMLVNFDAPARDECVAERSLSNSPQQALTLLNDPTFMEASLALANLILVSNPDANFRQRLDFAFNRAVSRDAAEEELESLEKVYREQLSYYEQNPQEAEKLNHAGLFHADKQIPAAEHAAWTQVCRVILNLHETITRY